MVQKYHDVGKPDEFVEKLSFLSFRKNKSMTQARTEGKEDVGSCHLSPLLLPLLNRTPTYT